jgi:arsenate reductase
MWEAALRALICPPSVLATQLDRLTGVVGLQCSKASVELTLRPSRPKPLAAGHARRVVTRARRGVSATVWAMEIWINPACSKCRSALTLLDAEGADYTVRRYLEDVPTEEEIRGVLARLGLEPWDITRTQEADAKELGLKDWPRDAASRDRWVRALAEHPRLIQRPIITADDGTAVVGRTDDAVRDVLSR